MAASEGYAIKLRQRRARLALLEEALERARARQTTELDRLRYHSVRELKERIEFERMCVETMAEY